MRIHVISSLSEYPLARGYNRNTVMQGLDGIDVTVAAGACEVVSQTIKLDPTSWSMADKIQLTACAQEPVPSDPAEVYQAKQIRWPFIEGYLFFDDFEAELPALTSAMIATSDFLRDYWLLLIIGIVALAYGAIGRQPWNASGSWRR